MICYISVLEYQVTFNTIQISGKLRHNLWPYSPRREPSIAQKEFSFSSSLFKKLHSPTQLELSPVLDSVVVVLGGHLKHFSCAGNSWYVPIGQSSHFPFV